MMELEFGGCDHTTAIDLGFESGGEIRGLGSRWAGL